MKNKEKKQIPVIGQGINKKAGITIFTLVMLIMGVIIVCYHNPLANQTDELVKKIIACTLNYHIHPRDVNNGGDYCLLS